MFIIEIIKILIVIIIIILTEIINIIGFVGNGLVTLTLPSTNLTSDYLDFWVS
jgi:hypothetical protein